MTDTEANPGRAPFPARSFPPPASISETARRHMAAVMAWPQPRFPDDGDPAAWRTHVAEIDGMIAGFFPAGGEGVVRRGERREIAGVPCYTAHPATSVYAPPRTILDIHGGGFIYMGGAVVATIAASAADRLGADVVSVDYRMPPDHPFPAALDDCLAVYRALLEAHDPADVVVHGGSAGGNLAAAMLFRARAEGLAMPAGLLLMSPAMDLTETGDTFRTLLGLDVLGSLAPVERLYAGGERLDDPLVSPLFGDFAGFPPTFLQSGTRDLFLSNTILAHRRMREAGVAAELHVWEAMPHAGFPGCPEDAELTRELHRFLSRRFAVVAG